MDMIDIDTNYLICQNKQVTTTGLSEMRNRTIADDTVTRFLRLNEFGSKSLWNYVKKPVREYECTGSI